MSNFTLKGAMSVNAFNGMHDTRVSTSLTNDNYNILADILVVAKLSVRSVTSRLYVPDDKIVLGNDSAGIFRRGQIFVKRATKGTACIDCLVPMDAAGVVALKAALATLKFQGEVPTSVNVNYTSV